VPAEISGREKLNKKVAPTKPNDLRMDITMRKTGSRMILVAMVALMASCQDRTQSAAGSSSARNNSAPVAPAAPDKTPDHSPKNSPDKWLGQWNGPEGTYLLLSRKGDKYVVKIQSLDGPDVYEGASSGDRIQFTRGGKTESIRTGSGEETGMKWLLDKKDCLIIKRGEGFCRK
jgi:hypothetical protein